LRLSYLRLYTTCSYIYLNAKVKQKHYVTVFKDNLNTH
jgi:hypothetical protein